MLKWLSTCIVVLIFSGCASRSVIINFYSSAQVNMDDAENALPVQVKVYQLSSPELFKKASFHELWKNDNTILGASLVEKQKLMVIPDSQRKLKLRKHKQSHYIGVVALFRDPQQKTWRTLQRMPQGLKFFPGHLKIFIKGNKLYVESINGF